MPDALAKRIAEKIDQIAAIADLIPGVIVIHDLPDFTGSVYVPVGPKTIG